MADGKALPKHTRPPKLRYRRFSGLKLGKVRLRRSRLKNVAKSHSQGWWQTKCDDLMQDVHKLMFDKCAACGGKNEVGHHFITKSLSGALRYNFLNLVPLCHSCHFKHHVKDDPTIAETVVRVNGLYWREWLEAHRRDDIKRGICELKIIHTNLTELLTQPIWTTSLGFVMVSEMVNTRLILTGAPMTLQS